MILISHRGNIDGKKPLFENSPPYIEKALKKGFDVEIDVWYHNNQWFLGHDEPQYLVKRDFLTNDRFWCHAKNLQAFEQLLKLGAHCFWHQEDDYTLTSRGVIWAYPGKDLVKNSICVMPERCEFKIEIECLGVCSDIIEEYRKKYGS